MLMAASIVGCGTGSPNTAKTVVATDVSQLLGIDWLDAITFVVAYSPDRTAASRLGSIPVTGGPLIPTPVAIDGSCNQVRLGHPHVVSIGQVAATYVCAPPPAAGEPDALAIVGVDWPSGPAQKIALVGDTTESPGQIATNPDGTRQLIALGDLCGVIVEATPTGSKPLPVEISDGAKHYRLDDLTTTPDCSARGWSAFPSWSPDGGEISFVGAPEAIGVVGPKRADVPANVYEMAPGATSATALIQNIQSPRDLDYSPDGRFLAFGGEINGRDAIWVFERQTGALRSVYDGDVDWLAWGPDSMRIAALEASVDAPPFPMQVVIVSAK